jgi:hypothetical protein
MVYLKATAVGLCVAVLFAIVWFVGSIVLSLMWLWWSQRGQGAAGIGAVSVGSDSALLAALVGFIVGFAWFVRRS